MLLLRYKIYNSFLYKEKILLNKKNEHYLLLSDICRIRKTKG